MDCISLPFTRQVNQSFGSEPSVRIRVIRVYHKSLSMLFAFCAVDRKCHFWDKEGIAVEGVHPAVGRPSVVISLAFRVFGVFRGYNCRF